MNNSCYVYLNIVARKSMESTSPQPAIELDKSLPHRREKKSLFVDRLGEDFRILFTGMT